MPDEAKLYECVAASSFLEYAFLRWVLTPAVRSAINTKLVPQRELEVRDRRYRVDYEIQGSEKTFVIELDGFEFHGHRSAFSYDRMRQNDLLGSGRIVVRFSYDSIRRETGRCVSQLQTILASDPALRLLLVTDPVIEKPAMDPDPLKALHIFGWHSEASKKHTPMTYFDDVRERLNQRTLRDCQKEAVSALANYLHSGGTRAACVMSVGSGKTALAVVATLAFTRKRALVVTPGNVIRGTFARAFDSNAVGNVLYGLPGGPLIPGTPPPKVRILNRDEAPIRDVTREQLLGADVIVTNFHSLGTGEDQDDLLAKLRPDDVDFIVVDEAHMAAAESYQRTFRHFASARTLLMSACFQRLDGKPIDADVVYRYRLIDAIADGNAKNLRIYRFAADPAQTTYEMIWPDGAREEITGKNAILELIQDERKLARITAKSTEPIRQVMRSVREALDAQTSVLHPVKPRVLFSALGERHAEQIARIAEEHGIPCAHLHHSMTDARITAIRERFEQESGDLQGIVQLRMLGQGYDFPPITIVVPMRPYNSFSEFYQFLGRGIRVLTHHALAGRVGANRQFLDIIYHADLGLDEHIDTVYRENDMDPLTSHEVPPEWNRLPATGDVPGTRGRETAGHPDTFVVFETGVVERRFVHDEQRVEQRRKEREREGLAQRYAVYAQSATNPVTFEQYLEIIKELDG